MAIYYTLQITYFQHPNFVPQVQSVVCVIGWLICYASQGCITPVQLSACTTVALHIHMYHVIEHLCSSPLRYLMIGLSVLNYMVLALFIGSFYSEALNIIIQQWPLYTSVSKAMYCKLKESQAQAHTWNQPVDRYGLRHVHYKFTDHSCLHVYFLSIWGKVRVSYNYTW